MDRSSNIIRQSLIPVAQLLSCETWDQVVAVEITISSLCSPHKNCGVSSASSILMISHRWETREHPDPRHIKLAEIQRFLLASNSNENDDDDDFQYVFFDYKCLDPESLRHGANYNTNNSHTTVDQGSVNDDLLQVYQLYAQAPLLCLYHGDYLERAWCLLELSLNLLHGGTPEMIMMRNESDNKGKGNTPESSSCPNDDIRVNMARFLLCHQSAKLGLDSLFGLMLSNDEKLPKQTNYKNKKHNNPTGPLIPQQHRQQRHQRHRATRRRNDHQQRIRNLLQMSHVTHPGDLPVILHLMDQLVGTTTDW